MRYKCTVSYDGTNFHGFQVQDNLRTVQKEIEDVLYIIHKKPVTIYASGRTDALVHARGQVFHFDSDIVMKEWNMKNALNTRLPKDIYIKDVEIVSEEFHSRFSAVKKEYHYLISLGEFDPLNRNYVYHPSYPRSKIDYLKMEEASKVFIGEHDFKSFTKNHDMSNTVREIYSLDFIYEGDLLTIKIVGNGFLHNMVRIIVGMLYEVGKGNITKEDLIKIMEAKDRTKAPKIAPSNGLYLYKVYYN